VSTEAPAPNNPPASCPICDGTRWIVWCPEYLSRKGSLIARPYRPPPEQDTEAKIRTGDLGGPKPCPECSKARKPIGHGAIDFS
jgi:rubredoxin